MPHLLPTREELEALPWQARQRARRRVARVVREHLPAVVAGIARSLLPSVARTKGAGAKDSAQRIRMLGTTPARIRAWCAENGVPCPARGVVPTVAVDAWAAAHPTTRTAEEAS